VDTDTLVPNEHITEKEIRKLQNEQYRLSAYRSLVFWTYPKIRSGERRPLPACVYAMVRAMFPPTDDEEYADYNHTLFTYEVAEQNA